MNVEPISFGTVADGQLTYYTCPMPEHAHVVTEAPGECPVCKMNLAPIKSS